MDLGCIDMGCIEKEIKESSPGNESDAAMASAKGAKSNMGVVNKSASQIKKSSHRKSSPLNWFPRKKVDSYLKRKIQLLQEVDGMNSTLDETLGDSNPHYSRVLREKMAVREAAHKAMEARKSAMVEASWCRILRAARIDIKEAEAQLLKAEKSAAEAFEAATAIGVIMYDTPGCPTKRYKIETTSPKGGSTTHTVKASFETAFDVDKQVAAAVKLAFMKLETCPSVNKDDLRELLRKISEHPNTHEHYQEISEFSSECESDTGVDREVESKKDNSQDKKYEDTGARQKKHKKRQVLEKFSMENLVDMMLERLRGLPEDELASLAIIVATCGLNAALADAEADMRLVLGNASTLDTIRTSSDRTGRTTIGQVDKKKPDSELPGLDKFLVKRLTRLEREVLDAKNAQRSQTREGSEHKPEKQQNENLSASDNASSRESNCDLGSVLHKKSSKFEREIEEAKKNSGMTLNYERKNSARNQTLDVFPEFGSMLVKHSSKLEKEIAEAKRQDARLHGKDGNKLDGQKGGRAKDVMEIPSLDTFLVKHVSMLEKEVQEAKNRRLPNTVEGDGDVLGKENIDLNNNTNDTNRKVYTQRHQRNPGVNSSSECEGLEKVLVKHVSRLEREKSRFLSKEDEVLTKAKRQEEKSKEFKISEGSLDQILVKHKSRLEIEQAQHPDTQIRHSSARREAREKELQEAWGGLSLGNSMRPHISKLERDKQPTEIRHSSARREAREKELQAAWGGLGLGNSMRPHKSKLERDKAAWVKAEEDQRMKAMEV